MSTNIFPITSRYYAIDIAMLELDDADETKIAYLRRRFCPQPERFALLSEHVVLQNERLDNITAHYLGDPEQFWRIADANAAMRPDEMTETVGRRLRITLPEGIPNLTGVSNA